MASNERKRALLFMTIAVLLWSVGGLLIKLSSWDALALNGGRNLVGAMVLWAYLRRPSFTWSRLQIGGAIVFAMMNTAYVLATQLTTAANAIFLHYTAPIWVLFLSASLEPALNPLWVAMAVGEVPSLTAVFSSKPSSTPLPCWQTN